MESDSSDNIRKTLARNVRAVMFDGDGVIFTGQVFVGKDGEIFKERSLIDGQGISLLRATGMLVAMITAERSAFTQVFLDKMNTLPSVKGGKWKELEVISGVIGEDKARAAERWIQQHNLSWDECAYMGDDIGDYAVMERVGFRACPSGAESHIKSFSHFVSTREGGKGAVRDFCNFLLEVKEVDAHTLSLW